MGVRLGDPRLLPTLGQFTLIDIRVQICPHMRATWPTSTPNGTRTMSSPSIARIPVQSENNPASPVSRSSQMRS
jgi:hypothetical protein